MSNTYCRGAISYQVMRPVTSSFMAAYKTLTDHFAALKLSSTHSPVVLSLHVQLLIGRHSLAQLER